MVPRVPHDRLGALKGQGCGLGVCSPSAQHRVWHSRCPVNDLEPLQRVMGSGWSPTLWRGNGLPEARGQGRG